MRTSKGFENRKLYHNIVLKPEELDYENKQ